MPFEQVSTGPVCLVKLSGIKPKHVWWNYKAKLGFTVVVGTVFYYFMGKFMASGWNSKSCFC